MRSAVWSISKMDGEESLYAILSFLLEEYIRIFGAEVMFNEPCIVYNDPTSESPMLVHGTPLIMRLSQDGLNYWAQTIFQLSHEMGHYAMRQGKWDKDFTLSWFEEIVCEGMSLYALEYAEKNWSKCILSKSNPGFSKHIQEYLNNELEKCIADGFLRCDTLEKLDSYEKDKRPENDRASHRQERNLIYQAISAHPNEVRYVLQYAQYVDSENRVLIDFDEWMKDNPSYFIRQLKTIQPVKSGRETSITC